MDKLSEEQRKTLKKLSTDRLRVQLGRAVHVSVQISVEDKCGR